MKCISLWQPWASLVALGVKRFETRSWETMHQGPIAIHAAKKWNRELAEICLTQPFFGALSAVCEHRALYRTGHALPFGAVVATARLSRCIRITSENAAQVDPMERAFGDYAPGRFMWVLDDVRALATPIPFKGAQSVFEIPDLLLRGAA